MTDSLNDIYSSQGYTTYAGYLRCVAERYATCEASDDHVLTKEDKTAWQEINKYLVVNGERELPFPAKLKEGFVDALIGAVNTRQHLHEDGHIFHNGQDAQDRVRSPERMQSLLWLTHATLEYAESKGKITPIAEPKLALWKASKDDSDVGWQVEEVDKIDFNDESTVLAMPGTIVRKSEAELASRVAKEVQLMLAGGDAQHVSKTQKPLGIYVIGYEDSKHVLKFQENQTRASLDGNNFAMPEAEQLVRNVLMPSLDIPFDKPLPLPALKRQMRQLNLFTFSYGSVVAQAIRHAFTEELLSAGYTPNECAAALCEVYALHIHPTVKIDHPIPHTGAFSQICVVSQNDKASQMRVPFSDLVPEGETAPTLVPVNEQTLMVWKDSPQNGVDVSRYMNGRYQKGEPASDVSQGGYWHDTAKKRYDEIPNTDGKFEGHRMNLATSDVIGCEGGMHDSSYVRNALRNALLLSERPEDLAEMFQHADLTSRYDPLRRGQETKAQTDENKQR